MSKRIKKEQSLAPRILRPFRSVGIVTNAVPSAVATLGDTYTVSTVVGRSVQVYDAASLRLLFLTQPPTSQDIECVAAHFHHVFVVSGSKLLVYRRGHLDAEADIPNKQQVKAVKLVVFGGYVCVCTPRNIHVFKWNSKTTQLQLYTSLALSSVLGPIVDACHPPTYLNKLVVATQSSLVLVNVKTGKTVHVYPEQMGGITKLECSPTALDTVAVATPSGDVVLQNLRSGKVLFSLRTGEPISSLTFRSDGPPLLGIGTAHGDVFFYDLDLQRRVQSLRGSSTGGTCNVTFLPGQPLVLVSGADNVLSEYVFDPPVTAQGGHRARLLRRRGGHGAPPSCMLFDEESHFVISGSLDGSLWMFSLRKDSQSRKLGNSKTEAKSAAVSMAYTPRKQWATLVTAFSGEKHARTWNAAKGNSGGTLPTPDNSLVKTCTVSNCGNFGLVGSASGSIAAYNLQSGIKRLEVVGAHKSAITGLAMAPNNSVVFSCSLDGTLKTTEFKTGKTLSMIDLGMGAITSMRYHAASRLLACATDDMCLAVVDTSTMRVVRELLGHGNRITSFDFTPSGRWLISASLDGTIRTWDVPSGACIDGIRLKNPVTQLCVSPNSEYVATAHVQGVGLQVWVLQTHTKMVRTMREEEFPLVDNTAKSVEGDISVEGVEYEENEAGLVPSSPTSQLGNTTTLSGEPKNKFTTLVHLDAIRERNKPTEGVRKPEKTPFFLGSVDSADTAKESGQAGGESKLTTMASAPVASYTTKFTELLQSGDLDGVVAHLTTLGPAATDLEIRSLDTQAPFSELVAFIDAMTNQIKKNKCFELVQAWMRMLLAAHRDIFADNEVSLTTAEAEPLRESFVTWLDAQKQAVDGMNEHIRYCLGVMSFLR